MRTVGEFVTHVSTQLNDQRPNRAFTRWGRGLLLQYLNLALAEIATYRPEAFAKRVRFDLVPGSIQTLPDEWDVASVDSNLDGTPVVKGDTVMAAAYNAYALCKSIPVTIKNGNAVYNVKTYSIDPENHKTLNVDPPVPAGISAAVYLNVLDAPADLTLADWNKEVGISYKFKASLVDYMLAAAFTLDTESPQSRARSDQLYDKFYKVMGVKYKQEAKYRAGYYLGKVGAGDPQVGNR